MNICVSSFVRICSEYVRSPYESCSVFLLRFSCGLRPLSPSSPENGTPGFLRVFSRFLRRSESSTFIWESLATRRDSALLESSSASFNAFFFEAKRTGGRVSAGERVFIFSPARFGFVRLGQEKTDSFRVRFFFSLVVGFFLGFSSCR